MELKELVHFSSHPRPFLLKEQYCSNPECDCNEAFLSFTELNKSGGPLQDPISFSIRVDLENWLERDPPLRQRKIAAWINEFLIECPQIRKTEFKAAYQEGRRISRRKAEFTLDADEVQAGTLVSYIELLKEFGELSADDNAFSYQMHHQGSEFTSENQAHEDIPDLGQVGLPDR